MNEPTPMNPMRHDDPILERIETSIRSATPHGRMYARALIALRVFAIALVLFFASLALSIFLHDMVEKIKILQFIHSPAIETALDLLFEFLVIALGGIAVVYAIYRQTDWPLVKNRAELVLGTVAIVAGISVGLLTLSHSLAGERGGAIARTTDLMKTLIPVRSYIERTIESNLEFNHYFVGYITSVRGEGFDTILTVEGRSKKTMAFIVNDDAGNYRKGEKVIVSYAEEESEGAYEADEVRKL